MSAAATKRATITLVSYKGEYFPFKIADLATLKQKYVFVFRIKQSLLDTLRPTLLKGVNIEVIDWQDLYPSVLAAFLSSIENTAEYSEVGNKVDMRYASDEESVREINARIDKFVNHLGRWGFKVRRENKPEQKSGGARLLTRLTILADENINPSYFFGSTLSADTKPKISAIHLSSSAKLELEVSASTMRAGATILSIRFCDKVGDDWVPSLQRAFDTSSVKEDDLMNTVKLLLALIPQ
jgi:hypothetical protein